MNKAERIGVMSVSFMVGACGTCKTKIVYNPHIVPSLVIPGSGELKPLCATCVNKINHARIVTGSAPFVIIDGTYTTLDELFKIDENTELVVVMDDTSYTGRSDDNPYKNGVNGG